MVACNQNPLHHQKSIKKNKSPAQHKANGGEKTMSLWLNTYLRAIEERDSKEKANESLFDTCVL